jgi:hypothetical protein
LVRPAAEEFPPDEGYHDLELLAIMERVTSEQICGRHRALEKLQQHLTTCKEFTMSQAYALVAASQESPLVSAQASYKIQFGILRYFASFGIHRKWPQGWDVIKHRLEDVFMHQCQQMAATGVSRQMFLSVFSKELDLFVDSNNVMAIESSVANNLEPPAVAWEDVVSSKLGLTLYAAEAPLASWKDHIHDVKTSIVDLRDGGFIEEDVLFFKERMTLKVGEIIDSGRRCIDDRLQMLVICGSQVELAVNTLDDTWRLPLYVLLTSCCVNSNILPALPWEEHLMELRLDRLLPETPSCIKPPLGLLSGALECRSHANAVLKGDTTYEAIGEEPRQT